MARLLTCGYELNSLTLEGSGYTGQVSIQTTVKRTGSYALKIIAGSAARYWDVVVSSYTSGRTYYLRAYLNIAAAPTAGGNILDLHGDVGGEVRIDLGADLTLKLIDSTGVDTQIGSASSALSLDTWYRLELAWNPSAQTLAARIDGVEFASGSASGSPAITTITLAANSPAGNSAGTWYYDDVAVNDSSGSDQNSYPGEGRDIILRPNAAGDSYQWTSAVATSYQKVDEVTPNDATDYVSAYQINKSDFYNCEDSGLADSDTIKLVQIGCRYAAAAASNNAYFKVQAKKAAGGTVSQSGQRTGGTSYQTVGAAHILYKDPDGDSWSPATVDSMQIGAIISLAGTYAIRLTTIWAYVEYVPGFVRHLTASATAVSSTPDNVAPVTSRHLTASALGESSTPDTVPVKIARSLTALAEAASVTPDVQVTMDGLIHLLASALAESVTPAITVTTARKIIASALAESATPDAAIGIIRYLIASATAISSTPDITIIPSVMGEVTNPDARSITHRREYRSITPTRGHGSITARRAYTHKGGL